MKTRYIVFIILAVIIGYLFYNKLFSDSAKKRDATNTKGKGGAGKKKNGPVAVKLMIVKDTTLSNNIDVSGTIDANEKVNLVSETAGNITAISFKEGTRVKKGQVLVKVYDLDLVGQLKQTQYQLALAKETEYRNKILLQKEAISQQEYDISLTALNTLNSQIASINSQIARRQIKAPFSGTIGLRNVSPGGYLSPNTVIASLVNMDPAKVTFSIPEKYLSLIHAGSKITFTINNTDKKFNATVYAIEPSIDLSSRTVTIRAKAPNPKDLLTAGRFAKINLALDKIPNTIMVPTECVIPDLKSSKVFIYHNGLAVSKPVKTDLRTDTKIQITKGLKPGDSLVVSGIIQLRPKTPLKISKIIK